MNFYDKLYLLAVDTKIEDALKEAYTSEEPEHMRAARRAGEIVTTKPNPALPPRRARRRSASEVAADAGRGTTAAGGGAPGLKPGRGKLRTSGGRPRAPQRGESAQAWANRPMPRK